MKQVIKRRNLSKRHEMMAYLIWCYCSREGWDVTTSDLCDYLSLQTGEAIKPIEINTVASCKGWSDRLSKKGATHYDKSPPSRLGDSVLFGENVADISARYANRNDRSEE